MTALNALLASGYMRKVLCVQSEVKFILYTASKTKGMHNLVRDITVLTYFKLPLNNTAHMILLLLTLTLVRISV